MKVKELIEKLQKVGPDLEVRVMSAEAREDDPADAVMILEGIVYINDGRWIMSGDPEII